MNAQNPKTGRSHRMIREALQLARDGYTVTVIGLFNEGEAKLRRLANELSTSPQDVQNIIFTKMRGIWDIENILAANGNDDKIKYLVDHAVIENQYRCTLDMLHRYG